MTENNNTNNTNNTNNVSTNLPTIADRFYGALGAYNESVILKDSAEVLEEKRKELSKALKARQAEQLNVYAKEMKAQFAIDPITAWKDYLASPWYAVDKTVTDTDLNNGTLKVDNTYKILPLSALRDIVRNKRAFNKAMVLWYLFVAYAFKDSDDLNPLRVKHPEIKRDTMYALKAWKTEHESDKEYKKTYAHLSMEMELGTGLAEVLLNDIVADILPEGMTAYNGTPLNMRKADVRNLRDSVTTISIATNGASKTTVHTFDSFLVQLVDTIYHRYNNIAYDVQDKNKVNK